MRGFFTRSSPGKRECGKIQNALLANLLLATKNATVVTKTADDESRCDERHQISAKTRANSSRRHRHSSPWSSRRVYFHKQCIGLGRAARGEGAQKSAAARSGIDCGRQSRLSGQMRELPWRLGQREGKRFVEILDEAG